MPSRHSGNLPQVLSIGQNKIVFQRSRTGAYAPPHFYAVNHRQMILVRGCYSIKLSGCQATVTVRHCFAKQNYLMLKRSQPLRSKPHFYAAKSSSDDFRLRLLLREQKRSRTGAYAPPHFYAVNHLQMILVRGCYCVSKNVLSHCVASRISMRRNRLLTISG